VQLGHVGQGDQHGDELQTRALPCSGRLIGIENRGFKFRHATGIRLMSTHPDVVEFMTLYEEVQQLSNGRPDRFPFLFKNNPKFAEICSRLSDLSWTLEYGVRNAGDTVFENVEPNFISKWRHYQAELDPYVSKLIGAELFKSLGISQWLFSALAEAGLRSTPDCRPRRALLHLSYSCAPPCGPAVLVTQDPSRTSR
jgi:hypothetical protein